MHNLFYLRIVFLLFTFFLYSAEESGETKDAMIKRLRESKIPARFAALSVCIEEEQKQQGIKVDYELISALDQKWTQAKDVKGNEYRKRKNRALLEVKAVGLHEVSKFLKEKIAEYDAVSAILNERIEENDDATAQKGLQKALWDNQKWQEVVQTALTADQQWIDKERARQKTNNDRYQDNKKNKVGEQPEDSDAIESELASTSDLAQRGKEETSEAMIKRLQESKIPDRFAALSVLLDRARERKPVRPLLISELDGLWARAKQDTADKNRRERYPNLAVVGLKVKSVGVHEIFTLLKEKIEACDIVAEKEVLQEALQADNRWYAQYAERSRESSRKSRNKRSQIRVQPEDSCEIESELASASDLEKRDEVVLRTQQSTADLEVDMAVGMEVDTDADDLFSLSGREEAVLSTQQSSDDLGVDTAAEILISMLRGFGSKVHTTDPHPPSRKRGVYVGHKKSKSAKRKKVAHLFTN